MSRFTDNLWSDLMHDHGPTLAQSDRPQADPPRRAALLRRPRIMAGGTLSVAGVAAGLVLALGAGGAAARAAFAVTTSNNGNSVLVQLNYTNAQQRTIEQVNAKLAAMGTGEQITIYNATGPASVAGAVTCSAAPGTSGPTIKVLEGTNGTQVIGAGQSAGNTAEGSFHLDRCVASDAGAGNTGSAGNS